MTHRCSPLGLLGLALASLAMPAQAQSPAEIDALVAEELLDHALAQCRAGQAEQAQRLAQDIREQFATTPAIEALLGPIADGACQAPAPTATRQRELHLSLGWDDNVNLGIAAASVTFQTPAQPITYVLDDSYQPVSSAYVSATAMQQYSTANGWTLQATAGARQLARYSPYNTLGLQLTGRRAQSIGGTPGHLNLGWAETWLGGQHHRSAPSIGWASLPSRGQQGWVVNANAQHHRFARTDTDARQLQAGITHQSRPDAHTQISWGTGLLHDQALSPRAGGHRQGTHLQASWQHARQGGLWHAEWGLHQWLSAQAFLPGLIEQRRSNATTTWVVGYQRPLAQGSLVYVEYQHRNSRDNVPLYAHRSNQLSMGWLLRWP